VRQSTDVPQIYRTKRRRTLRLKYQLHTLPPSPFLNPMRSLLRPLDCRQVGSDEEMILPWPGCETAGDYGLAEGGVTADDGY
jgi:hypothetical protein